MEQFFGMDNDHGRLFALGYNVQGHDGFTRAGTGFKHPERSIEYGRDRLLLIGAQIPGKRDIHRVEFSAIIDNFRGSAGVLAAEQYGLIGKPARKRQPVPGFLIKIQFGFELLADPAAVPYRRIILGIFNSQPVTNSSGQGGRCALQGAPAGDNQMYRPRLAR